MKLKTKKDKAKIKIDMITEKEYDELLTDISAELDATYLYEHLAQNSENKQFKTVFLKMANDERKRIGTFTSTLFK